MTLSNLSSSSIYKAQGGLLGAGRWATVTATTGSPTTGTYTDANGVAWKYYQWLGSTSSGVAVTGSFTVTDGVVEVLMVGGGNHHATLTPDSGEVVAGIQVVAAGTLSVSAGWNGVSSVRSPGPSGITGMPGAGSASNNFEATGAGNGRPGAAAADGVTSAITGTSIEYARGNDTGTPQPGDGIRGGSGGGPGVVIIRVPTAFAQA